MPAATWEWSFSLHSHWGAHAKGAIRALHRWLVDQARSARAAAAILWLTREDEALAWQVPAQRKALAAAGIPALILPATNWLADGDTLQQVTNFCRETFR
jgi:hypothetical protein